MSTRASNLFRSFSLLIAFTVVITACASQGGGKLDRVTERLVKDNKRVEFGSGNGPRLEVGRTYVIPLVPLGGGWAPLSFSTVTPVVNGVMSVGPEVSNPATRQLDGATLDDLSPCSLRRNPTRPRLPTWTSLLRRGSPR